jgi:hypothetical protein
VAPVVSSPAAGCASPLDRLGFGVLVVCTTRSTSLSVLPAPTSFYMAQGDGGPPAIWAGRPDQGAFVRARPDSDPLGSGSAGDQTNTSHPRERRDLREQIEATVTGMVIVGPRMQASRATGE